MKYPILLYHYVLMNTHFHFVIQAYQKETLLRHISYLKWHYNLWMKKKYGWKGPLWRERFKSLPIENERYLAACGSYIEYNPVRAGICENPEDYPYSSYRKLHLGINDDLIDEYGLIPDTNQTQSHFYKEDSSKSIFSHSLAIGSSSFIEKHKPR